MTEAMHRDARPRASVAAQAEPLARVYGEPFNELPLDLYIPPEALEVFLESFEGPLDLLLYLIRKQNINVLDIPMAELTRQYLGYVEMMRRTQLELAAEYLLMAAVLIEIKSRLLLPKPPAAPGDEGRGPARRAGAPPARIRADEAGRARDRRAAAGRPRFRDGARLVRARGRRRGCRTSRPTTCGRRGRCWSRARAGQPASSGHARAAVGAQRDEPAAEGAGAGALRRIHRRCSPRMPTSRIWS